MIYLFSYACRNNFRPASDRLSVCRSSVVGRDGHRLRLNGRRHYGHCPLSGGHDRMVRSPSVTGIFTRINTSTGEIAVPVARGCIAYLAPVPYRSPNRPAMTASPLCLKFREMTITSNTVEMFIANDLLVMSAVVRQFPLECHGYRGCGVCRVCCHDGLNASSQHCRGNERPARTPGYRPTHERKDLRRRSPLVWPSGPALVLHPRSFLDPRSATSSASPLLSQLS